ncbi:hypothetical protein B0H13DRAFT_1963618, partial [Mycena leptocephala]
MDDVTGRVIRSSLSIWTAIWTFLWTLLVNSQTRVGSRCIDYLVFSCLLPPLPSLFVVHSAAI